MNACDLKAEILALCDMYDVFLCYSVDIGSTESFLHGGELPTLIVETTGHAMHVFINGQLSGNAVNVTSSKVSMIMLKLANFNECSYTF